VTAASVCPALEAEFFDLISSQPMKDLMGSATGATAASVVECARFFRAVDHYPDWHPDVVRRVEVLERDGDGEPSKGRAMLHVAVGPLVKDFDVVLAVRVPDPHTVSLKRIPNHPGDDERFEVTWQMQQGDQTRLRLVVRASLSVPRFVPVGGIGDGLADGFLSAATRALAA
jgi:hypothetical protein